MNGRSVKLHKQKRPIQNKPTDTPEDEQEEKYEIKLSDNEVTELLEIVINKRGPSGTSNLK